MQMQQFIDLVNEDIERLYAAAIQYNNHAAMIEGAKWMGYASDLLEHAKDDFGQAQELSDKVQYYGGVPSVNVHQIKLSPDPKVMIQIDLDIQKESVQRYRERLQQAISLSLGAMADIYQGMVTHEEEHHNTTKNFLGDEATGTPLEYDGNTAPAFQGGEIVTGDPEVAEQLNLLKEARELRKFAYGSH